MMEKEKNLGVVLAKRKAEEDRRAREQSEQIIERFRMKPQEETFSRFRRGGLY